MTTPRVLVVDDDESIRVMVKEGLQRDGFEVVAASNVSDALRHIAPEKFDVLLSDLHMPLAGDGFGQRDAPYASRCVDRSTQWLSCAQRGNGRDSLPSR
jgi:CheY-like chemotaxis protein